MSTLASVILKDVIANLPAAGIPGRMFFATDTDAMLRDNGTSWDTLNVSGSISVPTATTSVLGVVKIDGASVRIASGVISAGFGVPLVLPAANGGTSYTLPSTPTTPTATMYFVRGLKWKYTTDYTISGTTLTIVNTAQAPQTGDKHELYAY